MHSTESMASSSSIAAPAATAINPAAPQHEETILNSNELSDPPEIDLKMWPTLGDDAKHGLAWDIAKAATENTEADPVAVLLTALTYSATYFGRRAHMAVGDDEHNARLFTLLIGSTSSARKGTSEGCVIKISKRVDEMLESKGQAVPNIKAASISSGEGLIAAVQDESEEKDNTGKPKHQAARDKRLLISDGEFNNYFSNSKREGNNASMLIRSAWDGKTLEPLTKKDRIRATDAHINILGHITLEEFLKSAPSIEQVNGALNRFLVAMVKRSKIVAMPPKTPDATIENFAKRLFSAVENSQDYSRELTLSEDALLYYRDELYPRYTDDSVGGVVGAATARSAPYVLRLALIFALLDLSTSVTLRHLKAASSVVDYCRASIAYIFDVKRTDTGIGSKILKALADSSDHRMMHSELKKLVGMKNEGSAFKLVVEQLQAGNKVRVTQQRTNNRTAQYIQLT